MEQVIDYTSHQLEAIALATQNLSNKVPLTRIGGYAGTGKTTILKEIYNNRPNGAICAFMGKACDVLRKKGLPGQTIHSLIYKWDDDKQQFNRIEHLDTFDWIGGDEFSLVGTMLWNDLQSFNRPILAVGDPFQLEPVNDDDPHLMRNPDFTLTEIHRQALDNPIIHLSMEIREGDEIDWRQFEKPINAVWDELLVNDIIICGTNKTRLKINKLSRQKLKFKRILEVGDEIVCKSNDRALCVFNGMSFTVMDNLPDGRWRLLTDDNKEHILHIAEDGFDSLERVPWNTAKRHQSRRLIADYFYGITAHSSQGSEWSSVGYIDESSVLPNCTLWDIARHRYTSVSRAKENLVVYKNKEDY